MSGPEGWHGSETADQYDHFARNFPMYQDTSADLVAHLDLSSEARVLDLACGTGVTTSELLKVLGPGAEIWAADSSQQMLGIAKRRVSDDRVRWRLAPAKDVAGVIDSELDAAACNSAIWQLGSLDVVFGAVRQVLRQGGEFVCNWGAAFLADAVPPGGLPDRPRPPLMEVARAHGLLPPPRSQEARYSPWPSVKDVRNAATASGLDPVEQWWMTQVNSPESIYEWLKTPVFSDWYLGHVPNERRRELLDEAWQRWEPKEPSTDYWFCLRMVAS